jgi:ATP diphosphatase
VDQWARIKARERADTGSDTAVLAGLPRALPALARAHTIGARVASVGFDWPEAGSVVEKIEEEVGELRAALAEGRGRTREEMGDLLFSIANLARKLGIDPEAALARANDKFTRRFTAVERRLAPAGRSGHEASLDVLEAAWTAVQTAPARSGGRRSGPSSPAPAPRGRRSRR